MQKTQKVFENIIYHEHCHFGLKGTKRVVKKVWNFQNFTGKRQAEDKGWWSGGSGVCSGEVPQCPAWDKVANIFEYLV